MPVAPQTGRNLYNTQHEKGDSQCVVVGAGGPPLVRVLGVFVGGRARRTIGSLSVSSLDLGGCRTSRGLAVLGSSWPRATTMLLAVLDPLYHALGDVWTVVSSGPCVATTMLAVLNLSVSEP